MNILIADDQTLFRDMMLSLLDKETDINLVGCVGNGQDVIAFCASRSVDLVLMDIRMPEMDGIAAARKLQSVSPETRVILLTAFEERDMTGLIGLTNIYGVLLKDIHARHLLHAIRMCADGLFIMNRNLLRVDSPRLANESLRLANDALRLASDAQRPVGDSMRQSGDASQPVGQVRPGSEPGAGSNSTFSSLDLQILQCLTAGMSNREIADSINYSEGTVKSRISRLLSEIGLKDRTQLALFALRHRLT